MKNRLKKVIMCMLTSFVLVACGMDEDQKDKVTPVVNEDTENNSTENITNEDNEQTYKEYYVKGEKFEVDGCVFTIDDVILDINSDNVCAVLVSVENKSDSKRYLGSETFYADNYQCKNSYTSGFDTRLSDYTVNSIASVAAGRNIKVYYTAEYPEDATCLEMELEFNNTAEHIMVKLK